MTVGELLREAAGRLAASGSETPRLDAELLLGHTLDLDRTAILAHPERPVSDAEATTFRSAIHRRALGEPVAYLRGRKEFHGLTFGVDRRALIPRPETERLVELAVAEARERLSAERSATAPLTIWDVGTGSGAVIVTLAVVLGRDTPGGDLRFIASDRSPAALALAADNATSHGVGDHITFVLADLLEPVPGSATSVVPSAAPDPSASGRAVQLATVDLVVANLPYIPTAAVGRLPVAASFEPRDALDGGPDGLALVRRLLTQLPGRLAPGGVALLEIGADQDGSAMDAARATLPEWPRDVQPDLGGRPRVLRVRRPARLAASVGAA